MYLGTNSTIIKENTVNVKICVKVCLYKVWKNFREKRSKHRHYFNISPTTGLISFGEGGNVYHV